MSSTSTSSFSLFPASPHQKGQSDEDASHSSLQSSKVICSTPFTQLDWIGQKAHWPISREKEQQRLTTFLFGKNNYESQRLWIWGWQILGWWWRLGICFPACQPPPATYTLVLFLLKQSFKKRWSEAERLADPQGGCFMCHFGELGERRPGNGHQDGEKHNFEGNVIGDGE